jgi:NADH-quinone oxidoreductase subunit G
MAEPVSLIIDGVEVTVPRGTLVVDAAKRISNDIPVFCYHPKLEPVGMCRMCLVDIGRVQKDRATGEVLRDENGQPKIAFGPKLETACTTPVEQGMVVRGATDKVKVARDDILEFLLTSHPLDCPICDKGGECPLQNLTIAHGPGKSRFILDEKIRLAKQTPLGDLIYLDQERCIQCARCTRFQDDIVGDHVIGFYERGRRLQIVSLSEPGFDSKFSGNTTDICPVGALTTADFRFEARPWELNNAASICPHCPVGCNLTLNTRREARAAGALVIKRVMPRQNEQVNEIWICDKGRFGHHFANSPDRLTAPLVRRDGELREATWEEALGLAASKLKEAGSGLVGLTGDRVSNEDLFNFRQVVTGLGGKAWLHSPMGGGELTHQVGIGLGSNLAELGRGSAILVVASDLEEEAPIWWLRIKQAAQRGATLIVAGGRPTKTERYASHVLRYDYGHEAATVLGMLVTGSSEAAEAFARADNAVIFYGREGLDLAGTSALAQACANLLVATGHHGRPNNGLVAVWPHNNTQGAWDMGLRPAGDALADGAQAAWIMAADPVGDSAMGADDLRGLGFVVVQELFLTETAKNADVVLPASSWAEREGSFTNGERRVQRFYPAITPKGRPDFQIVADLGERAGVSVPRHAALVLPKIAESVPAYAGLNYQKLAEVVEQWPDVGGRDLYYGGTSYTNSQGLGVQLPTAADLGQEMAAAKLAAPAPPEENGLMLVPATLLYDRGTLFVRSLVMHPRIPEPYVELSAADAERLGISDGDTVEVSAGELSASLTARVNGHTREGVVVMPESLGRAVPAAAVRATIAKSAPEAEKTPVGAEG